MAKVNCGNISSVLITQGHRSQSKGGCCGTAEVTASESRRDGGIDPWCISPHLCLSTECCRMWLNGYNTTQPCASPSTACQITAEKQKSSSGQSSTHCMPKRWYTYINYRTIIYSLYVLCKHWMNSSQCNTVWVSGWCSSSDTSDGVTVRVCLYVRCVALCRT